MQAALPLYGTVLTKRCEFSNPLLPLHFVLYFKMLDLEKHCKDSTEFPYILCRASSNGFTVYNRDAFIKTVK